MSTCSFKAPNGQDSILFNQLDSEYGNKLATEIMADLEDFGVIDTLVNDEESRSIENVPRRNEQGEISFEYVKRWVDAGARKAWQKSYQAVKDKPFVGSKPKITDIVYQAKDIKEREELSKILTKTYRALDTQAKLLESVGGSKTSVNKVRKAILAKRDKLTDYVKKTAFIESTKKKLSAETDAQKREELMQDMQATIAKLEGEAIEQYYLSYVDHITKELDLYTQGLKDWTVQIPNLTSVGSIQQLNNIVKYITQVQQTAELLLFEVRDLISSEEVQKLNSELASKAQEALSVRNIVIEKALNQLMILTANDRQQIVTMLAQEYSMDLDSMKPLLSPKFNAGFTQQLGKFLETNLGTPSESSSAYIALLDKMVQFETMKAEKEFADLEKEGDALYIELRDYKKSKGANVNNPTELFDFALQVDEQGKPTGRLIGYTNTTYDTTREILSQKAFDEEGNIKEKEDYNKYIEFLKKSHTGFEALEKERLKKQKKLSPEDYALYLDENFDIYIVPGNKGERDYIPHIRRLTVKNEYLDSKFKELKELPQDNPERKFYEWFIAKYNEFGALVPERIFQDGRVLLGVKKNLFDRISEDGNILSAVAAIPKNMLRNAADYLSDNSPYIDRDLIGADGNPVKLPRIQGIAKLNPEEQSFDIYRVLKVFASAVGQTRMQAKTMATLENAALAISNKEFFDQDKTGNIKVNQNGQPILTSGAKSRVYNSLMAYIGINMYGDGIVPKTITDKALKVFGRLSSWMIMGFNFPAFLPNMIIGRTTNWIEAVGGEFFTVKDLSRAAGVYNKELLGGAMFRKNEFGNTTSKLLAVLHQNDFLQDTRQFLKEDKFKKKGFVEKVISPDNFFVLQKIGDHTHQATAALAYMYNKKVKDKRDGIEKSFYDTIEYDGQEITYHADMSETELFNFLNATKGVVQALHGNYSDKTKVAAERSVMNQLLLAYRKWIKPNIDSRWRAGAYDKNTGLHSPWWDERIGKFRKGRFITTADFLRILFSKGGLKVASASMSELDRQNLKKMVAELSLFSFFLTLSTIMLAGYDDDDELAKNPLYNYSYYLTDRLATEMRFYFPIAMFPEGQRVFKSPFAAASALGRPLKLMEELGYSAINQEFRQFEGGYRKDKYKLLEYTKDVTPFRHLFTLDKWNQKQQFGQFY